MIISKNKAAKLAAKQSAMDTLIGKDSTIEGKVVCQASLRIEGKIIGDVECEGDVTVGREAVVHSTITAQNIINSGTIHGAIRSKGTFYIASTGKMYGDITVASLSIAAGGIFEGVSKMIGSELADQESLAEASSKKPRLHRIEGANQGSAQGQLQGTAAAQGHGPGANAPSTSSSKSSSAK